MSMVRRFWYRVLAFVRPRKAEEEMSREIAAHLTLLEDDYRRRGLGPEAARMAAVRALGGIERAKEIHRDHRSFLWLEDLRRDIPYAIRGLRRTPGFTIAAVFTVSLGVGATTAIVSIVNTISLRPLPYRDSERLVQIAENVASSGAPGRFSRRFGVTQAEFVEWRDRSSLFSYVAGVGNLMNGDLMTSEGRVAAPRAIVSPALFEMLGVPAQLGRTLITEDEQPDAAVAVASAAAWQRFFAGDPAVLGRVVTLNGQQFTIVGVMPTGFDYPERTTMFWTAQAPRPDGGTRAFGNFVAKLKPGVTLAAATQEANAIGAALRTPTVPAGYGANSAQAPPPAPAGPTLGGLPVVEADSANRPRFEVLSVKDLMVAPIRPALRVLGVAVTLVLLIVCANVANLLLARATSRRREIGVRLAIGAGRGRIIRQIATESAVLSLVGGLAGALVAVGGVQLVKTLATVSTPRLFQLSINLGSGSLLPRVDELGVDFTLLGFAIAIALVSSLLFGLAPAVSLARINYASTIGTGATARSDSAQPTRGILRSALVVCQVATATTLLIGAGLLVNTFVKLVNVNPGYDAKDVLTFILSVPPQMPGERQLSIIEQVIDRLSADPRVAAAGYTNIGPFLSLTERSGLFVPPAATREEMLADSLRPQTRIVSHGYLQTLGARLLAGRWLNEGDGAGPTPVLVVNRTLVERYFGGRHAIGTPVQVFRSPEYVETWQIVGVIEDMVQARLDQEPFPIVFADMRQILAARALLPKDLQIGQALPGFPTIAVRTRDSWRAISSELRPLVRAIDPTVGVDSIAPLEDLRFGSLIRPRFYAVLVGLFAAIAGGLAAIGIYGVLACSVAQRSHEIGVRMALGAGRGAVLRSILSRGLILTGVGVFVGLIGAVGVTRYLSNMLFALTPLDVPTFAAVASAFVAVAALACYVPARRATTIDPATALRD